jgi:hypothetical protein
VFIVRTLLLTTSKLPDYAASAASFFAFSTAASMVPTM